MMSLFVKHIRKITLFSTFIGLMLIFVGGLFSSTTKLEQISTYAAEVVKEQTTNKHNCALIVEKTPESGSVADPSSEFFNLYGVFKEQKITFASTINADKNIDVRINGVSENLSMLYVGAVGTIPYDGHYKHYISPMEVMFPDIRMYDISTYVAYISQSHADKILESNGVKRDKNGLFSSDDYYSLLTKKISITFEGVDFKFVIQNIYYENNYYYEGLNDVLGDFIIVSYYVPLDLMSKRQNLYFINEYPYQNRYFMNYINSVYSSKKYSVTIGHYNLTGEINEEYLLGFYYSNLLQQEWLAVFIFVISFLLVFIPLGFTIFLEKIGTIKLSLSFYTLYVAALLVPFLIFFSIYNITTNIVFLTGISSKMNGIAVLICIFVLFIAKLIKINFRHKLRYIKAEATQNEIGI